jgi:hypothetical protein
MTFAASGAISGLIILEILNIMLFSRRTSRYISAIQLSHLVCEHCGFQYDYAWIPSLSVTSSHPGKTRLFRCPRCGESSWFNLWDTKVDPLTHHCEMQIGLS